MRGAPEASADAVLLCHVLLLVRKRLLEHLVMGWKFADILRDETVVGEMMRDEGLGLWQRSPALDGALMRWDDSGQGKYLRTAV